MSITFQVCNCCRLVVLSIIRKHELGAEAFCTSKQLPVHTNARAWSLTGCSQLHGGAVSTIQSSPLRQPTCEQVLVIIAIAVAVQVCGVLPVLAIRQVVLAQLIRHAVATNAKREAASVLQQGPVQSCYM